MKTNRTEPLCRHELPPLGLGCMLVGNEELELVAQVFRTKTLNRYYTGPHGERSGMVDALEDAFSDWLGLPYCLGLTSCTAALETAFAALGIGPGDEVIIPAWSWRSCFTSVVRVGALPVMAEIDASLCLDPAEIERLATPRTKAVLVVHFQGAGVDMPAIMAASQKHGIAVVEDCAESIGAKVYGKKVGTYGDIAVFSFQHQKIITSGEGGMLATANPDLYERAVRFHDLGKYRPRHEEVKPPSLREFSGSQFRMSELTGAVALAQFRRLPAVQAHCRRLFDTLWQRLQGLEILKPRPQADPDGDFGFELYLYLESPALADSLRSLLREMGVNCGRLTQTYPHYNSEYCNDGTSWCEGLGPAHGKTEWPAKGYRPADFPRTEAYISRLITLPIGVLYSEEDVEFIASSVADAVSNLTF